MTFPEHLDGPDESLALSVIEAGSPQPVVQAQFLIKEIFFGILEDLLREESEFRIELGLADAFMRSAKPESYNRSQDYRLGRGEMKALRLHLEGLGLIKAIGRTDTRHDWDNKPYQERYIAWTLTEKGRRYMTLSGATAQKSPAP